MGSPGGSTAQTMWRTSGLVTIMEDLYRPSQLGQPDHVWPQGCCQGPQLATGNRSRAVQICKYTMSLLVPVVTKVRRGAHGAPNQSLCPGFCGLTCSPSESEKTSPIPVMLRSIPSILKILRAYYVPGTLLNTGDSSGMKTKLSPQKELHSSGTPEFSGCLRAQEDGDWANRGLHTRTALQQDSMFLS